MRKIVRNTGDAMASVGLSEAAKLTGRNPSTLHRAMKQGRLSFTLGAGGERRLDPAELDRVFGLRINGRPAIAQATKSNAAHEGEIAALQELIRELRADKEDLRRRLDQSTAMLADWRQAPPRPWWRRLRQRSP